MTKIETREDDRRTIVPERLFRLITNFEHYLSTFDADPPFTNDQLRIHQEVICKRRELGTIIQAIDDDLFLDKLRKLLEAWGMDSRASVLSEPKLFKQGIREKREELLRLSTYSISNCSQDHFEKTVIPLAVQTIRTLNVNHNNAKLVVGFKVLHHLLPELIPPLDREYTGRFFIWHGQDFQYQQEKTATVALGVFGVIARSVSLNKMVGPGWRTSVTSIM